MLDNKKNALCDDELEQVTGGGGFVVKYVSTWTVMECSNCHYSTNWNDFHLGDTYTCPKCDKKTLEGVSTFDKPFHSMCK